MKFSVFSGYVLLIKNVKGHAIKAAAIKTTTERDCPN